MRVNRKLALAVVATGAFASSALAADRTWDGFISNVFALNTNWTTAIAPISTDTVRFTNQAGVVRSVVVLDASKTVAGVNIDGTPGVGAYEFQKQNGALLTSTGELLIGFNLPGTSSSVTFNGFDVTCTNLAVAGVLTTSGNATDTASAQLSAEAGGVINVGIGTLNGSALFIDANNSRININNGGMLQYSGFSDIQGTLTLNSGGTLNIGAAALTTNAATGFIQFNRTFSLPAGKTINIALAGDFASTDFVDIGAVGDGTLLVNGAGSSVNLETGSTSIYSDWGNNAHTATVNFSNSGTGDYNHGLQIAAAGSFTTARVNLTTSASLNVDGFLTTGGTNNTASITINNATLSSTGLSFFGNGTTISLEPSGKLAFSDNATFSTGSTLNWSGGTMTQASGKSINVAGGSINNTSGGIELGNGVTLNILNSGGVSGGTGGQFANSRFFDIANGNATGTMHVDGANSIVTTSGTTTSDWGASTGHSATITFSNSGAGTYNGLRMSAFGGTTRLTLSSAGQLNVSTLTVGSTTVGSNASITINGGKLNTLGLATFLSGTNINLSTGTLALGGVSTFSTGANLTQTGGTFSMPTNSNLTFEAGGTGSITANAIPNGTTVRVTNGGSLTVNNFLDIANQFATGSLLVDGGTSSFAITGGTSSSIWGNAGGNTADVTVSNGAFADLTGIFFLEVAPASSKARINLLNGGKMNVHGLRTGDAGGGGAATITIDASRLTTTGTVLFSSFSSATTLVNLQNNGSLNFTDGATFSTGSTLNFAGGTLTIGTGDTLSFSGGVGSFTGSSSLNTGATLQITNNGHVIIGDGVLGTYDVGNTTTGTLTVSGPGSYFNQNGFFSSTVWGGGATGVATINFSNFGAGTFGSPVFIASGGAATVNLNNNAKLFTNNGLTAGSLGTSSAVITINGGTLANSGSMNIRGGAVINYQVGSFSAGTLNMSDNGQILLATGSDKTLRAKSLSFSGTSKLDLSDNTLIIDYSPGGTPITSIRGFLATARGSGSWTGNGLTSSSAATVASNPGFFGYSSALGYTDSGSSLTVKYTLTGDANVDGKVNALDFNALATNFGKTPGSDVWTQGDFNYDGSVNTSDFTAMAGNFNATPLSEPPVLGSLVPEPATIASLVALGALLRRRRP